jgi:hypothetical protein
MSVHPCLFSRAHIIGLLSMTALSLVAASPKSIAATILLNDTWADGSRTETSLPNESAVYASAAGSVAMASGSLSYTQSASSQRLATYFTPNGAPVQLAVGDYLKASVQYVPKGALYNTTSRNFRVGLFHDPTNAQISADGFNDGGGAGNPWEDARGYAVFMPLTMGPSNTAPFQINKRTVLSGQTSLMGSGGAYTNGTSGGANVVSVLDKVYTITFEVAKVSASQTDLTLTLLDGNTVLSTHTSSDDGSTYGAAAPYDNFDLLAFRFSSASGTADVLEFRNFQVETGRIVPEPTALVMLGLAVAGLVGLRRRS